MNFELISQLLSIIEKLAGHPNLSNLRAVALMELSKAEMDAWKIVDAAAKKAQAEAEEAAKKKAAEEAKATHEAAAEAKKAEAAAARQERAHAS